MSKSRKEPITIPGTQAAIIAQEQALGIARMFFLLMVQSLSSL
jgi:hypothetical protein